jgi:aminopeptidase N
MGVKTNRFGMLPFKHCFFLFLIAFISSCSIVRKRNESQLQAVQLDTLFVQGNQAENLDTVQVFRASEKRIHDLIHTSLDVRFDWSKSEMAGKATLTLKPYFYPSATLVLDAKGFLIHEVSMVTDSGRKALNYSYDSLKLTVSLGRDYKESETYTVFIDYTARPEKLENKGGTAITDTKGLYFINPLGTDKKKPRQLWTQGETEYSSAWFPTIDRPNERMTQEISMTVDTAFMTVSNGLLMYSKYNNDGTRTDVWKQSVPAAPYLTMMAVGKFAVIKDKWRGIEVHYLVDPAYARVAKRIFGNTPEMIEFFSKKLGVDFPWEKYYQVVVHDYVSGAMENSSAVIFGSFMQRDERELVDRNHEDIVSHELFHHWFGDLVTCESWSNLPLNESFATYGEYLWNEHKYGRDDADNAFINDLKAYLSESKQKQVSLIRFFYEDKEDLFDAHSYQKGGRILHMLRKYVGDEAFFKALNVYLQENKFTAVEFHQLRLAFEQVTGEDLNWFFNQWFLTSGHPVLEVSHDYDDSLMQEKIVVSQRHSEDETLLFELPVDIDIYAGGKAERKRVVINQSRQEFVFPVAQKPDLVNVDAEKMMLCVKTDLKSEDEWAYQYYHAPLLLDRLESVGHFSLADSLSAEGKKVIMDALSDRHWKIRENAVAALGKLHAQEADVVREKLDAMFGKERSPQVKTAIVKYLSESRDASLAGFFRKASVDSSYMVSGAALAAMVEIDSMQALELARKMIDFKNPNLLEHVAGVFAKAGKDSDFAFFEKALNDAEDDERLGLLTDFSKYLKRQNDSVIQAGLLLLESNARHSKLWYVRLTALNGMAYIRQSYQENAESKKSLIDLEVQQKGKADPEETLGLLELSEKISALSQRIEDIKKEEKDPSLIRIYNSPGY